ncbi:MAG: PLDc_N domain-containing protein [Clostridia bacterium]|nr:PLDc_N domain-containing protein [Clostridia bacterium]
MDQEEYEELQRLTNEYNRLVARRNNLVNEYNQLVAELNFSMNATVELIERGAAVQRYIVPRLAVSSEAVTEVANLVKAVEIEIDDLSKKYFIIKNISTASKKLTQLNNDYQKNFGLYQTLRRVTLGYVVGMDKNIVSNERLRLTVEKNYLQNADYWISHCIMATMLWVSDEKEAADRAVAKALSIDKHKSMLFFLLINLSFGRHEAAEKWYELYIQEIDVNNVGDEMSILLQVYLYNICGTNPEFKARIREKFNELLQEIRNTNLGYDKKTVSYALEYISAYVHKAADEFVELQRTCGDYRQLINALSDAEKNSEFAKYFDELYNEDSSAPASLSDRIQNVLYDLINMYDEAEFDIIKSMDYYDMVLKARGDVEAANKMHQLKYAPRKSQSLGDLMLKIALPASGDGVDLRVRKFAVSFLVDSLQKAFEQFRKQYQSTVKDTHEVTIDTCKVTVDEKAPEKAALQMRDYYKKNRNRFISQNKGVKILTGVTIGFFALWLISIIASVFTMNSEGGWPVWLIVLFVVSFIGGVGFLIWLIFKRRSVGAKVTELMNQSLERLQGVIKAIQEWRKQYTEADAESAVLYEVLNKFKISEEE